MPILWQVLDRKLFHDYMLLLLLFGAIDDSLLLLAEYNVSIYAPRNPCWPIVRQRHIEHVSKLLLLELDYLPVVQSILFGEVCLQLTPLFFIGLLVLPFEGLAHDLSLFTESLQLLVKPLKGFDDLVAALLSTCLLRWLCRIGGGWLVLDELTELGLVILVHLEKETGAVTFAPLDTIFVDIYALINVIWIVICIDFEEPLEDRILYCFKH